MAKQQKAKAKKAAVGSPCLCGCGETTKGGKFRPGHDARLRGLWLAVVRGKAKPSTVSREAAAWAKDEWGHTVKPKAKGKQAA